MNNPKHKALEKKKLPRRGSVENIIEKKSGWKAGMKQLFDTALLHKDKETIKRMLADVPYSYRILFADKIRSILHK